MGLQEWRKSRRQDDEKTQASETSDEMNEKTLAPPTPNFYASGQTTPGHLSAHSSGHSTPQRQSLHPSMSGRPSFSGSARSVQSMMMDDIKHEVMVNYLFQQQCSALWVGDGSGTLEGVMLRKAKNVYMSCPPQLVESPFGMACAALNVQVCRHSIEPNIFC
jgi:hypothetical protein